MITPRTKQILVYCLAAFAVIFLFLFQLGQIPLWSSDEGRFGAIARTMWGSKDFIIPHFNQLPYLEKPVLAPFLTAMSYGVFGINELSTRLVSVISAILGVFFTFYFARRFFGKETAFYSAVILTTTVGYVFVGRFAVIDMLMTLLMTGSLFCLMAGYFRQKHKFYLAAYVFMGLAFLTKGLIGLLLPALIFFVFLIWNRDLKAIKNICLLRGILILSFIILPWCILVSMREPEFFKIFIIQNHFSRFATDSFGRARPFWFFVPVFIAIAFPWSLFTPAAVSNALKEKKDAAKFRFLFSWLIVVFVFFSIPKSKLPYYLLPISVPFAILVASYFSTRFQNVTLNVQRSNLVKWIWRVFFVVCILGVVGLNIFLLFGAKKGQILMLRPYLQAGSLIILLGSICTFYFQNTARLKAVFYSMSSTVYLGLLLTFLAMKAISPYQSTYVFAQTVMKQIKTGDIVAVKGSPDSFSDFLYYVDRPVIIAGADRGTSEYQSLQIKDKSELDKRFLSTSDFVHLFKKSGNRVFCLLRKKHLGDLEQEASNNYSEGLQPYTVIQEAYGKILISNK